MYVSWVNDITPEHYIYSGLLVSEGILMVWIFLMKKIALFAKFGIFLDLEVLKGWKANMNLCALFIHQHIAGDVRN